MILFFSFGYIAYGVLAGVLALAQLLTIIKYYDILEHTTIILLISKSILLKYNPMVIVVYSFWIGSFIISMFYIYLLTYSLYHTSNQTFIMIVLFSYLWTLEVITEVLHETVSYIVCGWYYRTIESPSKAVKKYLLMSFTKNFGSINLPSILISAFRLFKSILSAYVGTNIPCTLSPAQEALYIPDIVVSMMNRLTITHIALKDISYVKSMNYMWDTMKNNAAFLLSNNLTTFNALRLGGLVWSLLLGIIMTYLIDWESIGLNPATIRLFSIIVGYLSGTIFIGTYQSSLDSMMICLSKNGSNGHQRLEELSVIMESLQFKKIIPQFNEDEASEGPIDVL